MRKTSLIVIAIAAALMLGLGGWAISMPHDRMAPPTALQMDPLKIMTGAKNLPTQHFDDYSLVF
jgi:hypothetical protein